MMTWNRSGLPRLTTPREATLPQYPGPGEEAFPPLCKNPPTLCLGGAAPRPFQLSKGLCPQEKVIPQHPTCSDDIIPPSRAYLICPSRLQNTANSDSLQAVLSPKHVNQRWKHFMISRPCRISLETAKIPSRSLPSTSLWSRSCHRRGNFSLLPSIDEPHLTERTSIIMLVPHPTLKSTRGSALPSQSIAYGLIGRLSLINNHRHQL